MILLITGIPCSGKTLLRKLCNSHPAIKVTEEFGSLKKLDVPYMEHVRALDWNWHNRPLARPVGNSPLWQRLINSIFVFRYLIELRVRCQGLVSVQDVEGVLRHIFQHSSVVGDTHGRYCSMLSKLASIPGLLSVVMYRDCRDLISGRFLRRVMKKRRAASVVERARTVKGIARGWVRAIEETDPYTDRVHVIRYEDLVTDPQSILAVLSDRLGVDPRGFQHQMVSASSVGTYQRNLSEEEVSRIIEIAGPTMKRLGYL